MKDMSESIEDYLEVILDLEQTHKVARAKDIADRLGFQRGSVTGALKKLGDKGLIHYKPYSFITLTREGRKLAQKITQRHEALKEFFLSVLQLDPETAEQNACRMEHAIDQVAFERLVCFIDYIRACPRTDERWLQYFNDFCSRENQDAQNCEACISEIKHPL